MERKIILRTLGVAGALLLLAWGGLIFLYTSRLLMFSEAEDRHLAPLAFLLFISVFLIGILATWVGLCFYVYHDSAQRGMNRVLWTLVAIFTPNLLGFVVYLILRKPLLQQCPGCSRRLEPQWAYCTNCGTPLKRKCPACQAVVLEYQKFCGVCGTSVQLAQG